MKRLNPLRQKATPYALAGPGVLFLFVFFAVPGLYLVQTSLQSGSYETGYQFDWAWSNFGAVIDYAPISCARCSMPARPPSSRCSSPTR